MKILGVDPGKHSGVAMLEIKNKRAKLTEAYVELNVGSEKFRSLIEQATYVVVEDFKVRPGKARQGAFDWDQMETPKIIGKIELLADELGKKIILQQPSVKPVGYGYAGMKYVPGKSGMHVFDAAAHALFYLVKNDLSLPSKLT